jgi:hypothetical protein
MKTTCRTSLFTLALAVSLFTGCSKHSPQESAAPRPKVTNLGVVEFSNGKPSRHDLGGGRVCIITPTVQKDGSVLLAMTVEESGKKLAASRIETLPDRAVEISFGDISLGFTPQIKP